MTTLNEQLDASLEQLESYRKTKFAVAITVVVAAVLGLLAITSLMYSSTPAEAEQDRIGARAID